MALVELEISWIGSYLPRRDDDVVRIVLSRKGFDSGSGGWPSPVLPDGRMVSIPIPEPLGVGAGATPYDDIAVDGRESVGDIAIELGIPSRTLQSGAHLDPDLDVRARPRAEGWRASLGQAGAAAGHLRNRGVTTGDLFVFWGLFRHTERAGGRLRWTGKPFHAVFGWLHIGEVLDLNSEPAPDWARGHPHVVGRPRSNNTLYLAADQSSVAGAGAGRLTFHPRRRLTHPEGPLSRWLLPSACHPSMGSALSYHHDDRRWSHTADGTELRVVGRGQEFVADPTSGWRAWVASILTA